MAQLTRDEVRPIAEQIAGTATNLGLSANVDHSATSFGRSSYVKVKGPLVDAPNGVRKYFNMPIRVSDHSVGDMRMRDYDHVGTHADAAAIHGKIADEYESWKTRHKDLLNRSSGGIVDAALKLSRKTQE